VGYRRRARRDPVSDLCLLLEMITINGINFQLTRPRGFSLGVQGMRTRSGAPDVCHDPSGGTAASASARRHRRHRAPAGASRRRPRPHQDTVIWGRERVPPNVILPGRREVRGSLAIMATRNTTRHTSRPARPSHGRSRRQADGKRKRVGYDNWATRSRNATQAQQQGSKSRSCSAAGQQSQPHLCTTRPRLPAVANAIAAASLQYDPSTPRTTRRERGLVTAS